MASLDPYLHFNGNCEEAFTFYQSIFGGELQLMRYKDSPPNPQIKPEEAEQVMHVSLPIGRNTLMGSDFPSAYGRASGGTNFYITVNADSQADADKYFEGLAAGGKVGMPMAHQFWGSYFGMVTDKFGTHWMISFANPTPAN